VLQFPGAANALGHAPGVLTFSGEVCGVASTTYGSRAAGIKRGVFQAAAAVVPADATSSPKIRLSASRHQRLHEPSISMRPSMPVETKTTQSMRTRRSVWHRLKGGPSEPVRKRSPPANDPAAQSRQNSWVAAAATQTPDSAITLTSEPIVALLSDGQILSLGGGPCESCGAGIHRCTLRRLKV